MNRLLILITVIGFTIGFFQNCSGPSATVLNPPTDNVTALDKSCGTNNTAAQIQNISSTYGGSSDEEIKAALLIYASITAIGYTQLSEIGFTTDSAKQYGKQVAPQIIFDGCAVVRPYVQATVILNRIKFSLSMTLTPAEDVSYSDRFYQSLTSVTPPAISLATPTEVLASGIQDITFDNILKASNYVPDVVEAGQLKTWIAQQLLAGVAPNTVASIGLSWFILNRAIQAGYVCTDYYRDAETIVRPLLAAGKSADYIVSKLTVNVPLACGISAMKIAVDTRVSPRLPRQKTQAITRNTFSASTKLLTTQTVTFNTDPTTEYVILSKTNIRDEILGLQSDINLISSSLGFMNSFLVKNLSSETAGELLRRGYKIIGNAPVKFLSMASCPYTNYSPTFLSMTQAKDAMSVTQVHNSGIHGEGIKLAILDTGVQTSHPDFSTCDIHSGYGPTFSINDDIGHGTHVTSIAAGLDGIAPRATVNMYKITGSFTLTAILNKLADDPPKSVNMSFSVTGATADREAINSLINDLTVSLGITFVAATGNCQMSDGISTCDGPNVQGILSDIDGVHTVGAPAGAERAIAAGVLSADLSYKPLISLPGPLAINNYVVTKPDIIAPGNLICAAASDLLEASYGCSNYFAWSANRAGFQGFCDDSHALLSGSSMASPMISGSVALLLQSHPAWNPDEVKAALKMTAMKKGKLFDTGAGLAQVSAANAINGYPPVVRLDRYTYNQDPVNGVTIKGAVYDRDSATGKLVEYRVSIGQGRAPLSFTLLKTFRHPVGSFSISDTLFSIDSIPPCFSGEYLIKIEAEDTDGNVATDYVLQKW